jgi:hypothetical protein
VLVLLYATNGTTGSPVSTFRDVCSATSFVERERPLGCQTIEKMLDECENAAAISYMWGEFDRTPQKFGHDPGGHSVSLTLGAEWDVSYFVEKLVMLTSLHTGCWMDQICIPQKEEDIPSALATIPTIYGKLDVVALLPWSPCRCLSECIFLSQND